MEFKGTKGNWRVGIVPEYNNTLKSAMLEIQSDNVWICKVQNNGVIKKEEGKANALLISKAPEMLEMLNKARLELSRVKSSMMAHPDCTIGSEFDDYTSSAQECENEIELLVKEATEL